jgi:hypothetical protein
MQTLILFKLTLLTKTARNSVHWPSQKGKLALSQLPNNSCKKTKVKKLLASIEINHLELFFLKYISFCLVFRDLGTAAFFALIWTSEAEINKACFS